jgi:nucleoside diphosphate kinase
METIDNWYSDSENTQFTRDLGHMVTSCAIVSCVISTKAQEQSKSF